MTVVPPVPTVFDPDTWKRREFLTICADTPGYTWQEFEWELEHSTFYNEDGDDAPFPKNGRGEA